MSAHPPTPNNSPNKNHWYAEFLRAFSFSVVLSCVSWQAQADDVGAVLERYYQDIRSDPWETTTDCEIRFVEGGDNEPGDRGYNIFTNHISGIITILPGGRGAPPDMVADFEKHGLDSLSYHCGDGVKYCLCIAKGSLFSRPFNEDRKDNLNCRLGSGVRAWMDWNPGGAIKIPIPFDRGSESWEECNNHSDWKLVTGEE